MIGIDMEIPKRCNDCPCAYFTEGAYKDICQITKENLIDEKDEFGLSTFNYPKPKWCPLKEVKGMENKE
jgi:hypothetical protein